MKMLPVSNLSRAKFCGLMLALGSVALPGRATAAITRPPWYPLPPSRRSCKGKALVLSGGGARGAYEAGVLKWLFREADRCGAPYDVICGTSAGAINAAFAAQGTSAAIASNEQLWRDMPAANILQYVPQVEHAVEAAAEFQESQRHGFPAKLRYLARAQKAISAIGPTDNLATMMNFSDGAGVHKMLKKYAISYENLRTSLIVTATNVTQGCCEAFYRFCGSHAIEHGALHSGRTHCHDLTEGNLVSAVLASTAMPGVFAPVPIQRPDTAETELYVDGGCANNTPVGLAIDAGATDITVVMVSAPGEATDGMLKSCHLPPRTLVELFLVCQALTQHKILEDEMALAAQQNLTIRVIRPHTPLDATAMSFNDATLIDKAITAGYADAQRPQLLGGLNPFAA